MAEQDRTLAVDAAIIGGGPAGLACALALQKQNISAVVIEKRRYPREKTCGGLLTQKTVDRLQTLIAPDLLETAFCDRCDELELYDRDRQLTDSRLTYPFRSVRRKDFDAFLAAQYRARGGDLREETVCDEIDPQAHTLRLSTGETVRYRSLVVADGARSVTRQRLGYREPRQAFCVETHVPRAALPQVRAARIIFGLLRGGYAWVFPSGETFCIGLGSRWSKDVDYVGTLKALLRQLGSDPDAAVIRGAFVPYGQTVRQQGRYRNVLLVGDAGGFVDPIYGEGLYFALTSGILAAEAIAQAPDACLPVYRRKMKPSRTQIRRGALVQRLFFAPGVQKRLLSRIAGRSRFVGFYCDRQLAFYTYPYTRLLRLRKDYRESAKSQP